MLNTYPYKLTAIVVLLLCSCSDVGGFQGDRHGETTSEDMDATDKDMAHTSDMASMCTPIPKLEACMGVCGERSDDCGGTYDCGDPREESEVCAATCGAQPDGCGGTIDCPPCTCENGAPRQSTCGPCNLGTASCNEQNEFSCALPPIPDIETLNCELDLVYVWDGYGGAQEVGARTEPFKSLKDATTAANANGSRAIIIQGENTYEDGPYYLDGSVSLVGGFGEHWSYDPSIRPTLSNQIEADEDSLSLEVKNVISPTVFSNIIVQTKDAPPGRSSYGVIAITANRLTLDHVSISSGQGGDGTDGWYLEPSARHGHPGESGDVGQLDDTVMTYKCAPGKELRELWVEVPCLEATALGGQGGAGGCTNQSPQKGDFSAQGTRGGQAVTGPGTGGINGRDAVNTSPPGEFGQRGTRGTVFNGRWQLTNGRGGDGKKGATGKGGGGGSGAHYQENPYAGGPSGGMGGGGGCGGPHGEGGTPGGSSLALLTIDSFGMRITNNSELNSKQGGKGGNGGNGGKGGRGGTGGEGSNIACKVYFILNKRTDSNCISLTYKSGDGGDGANGLPGGPGGGGAGGDSIGIYCHNSNIAIDPSSSITSSNAGMGGTGGTYDTFIGETLDQPKEDGENGISAASEGCN